MSDSISRISIDGLPDYYLVKPVEPITDIQPVHEEPFDASKIYEATRSEREAHEAFLTAEAEKKAKTEEASLPLTETPPVHPVTRRLNEAYQTGQPVSGAEIQFLLNLTPR